MMKNIICLLSLLMLTACSSPYQTSVIPLPKKYYRVVATSKINGEALRGAINKASEVCGRQGEQMMATDFRSDYISVQVPSDYRYHTVIVFTCGHPFT
jgi:putative hemolysin